MKRIKVWVEAMRLRTLPVSIAGVLAAWGLAVTNPLCQWVPGVLCMLFAVLAQVASNFANEYFDFRAGADRPGRQGPRRGVAEGEISPKVMLWASIGTLGAACLTGLSLLLWGPWWLIGVGAGVAVGVMAYSTGPWPLSRHCLGEVAVVFFFGLIPVTFTYYLMTGAWSAEVVAVAAAVGLLGANVLIVNNYRDVPDDIAAGKHTLATQWGGRAMVWLYAANGVAAALLWLPAWITVAGWWIATSMTVLLAVTTTAMVQRISRLQGRALNPWLGRTAILLLTFTIIFGAFAIFS